MGFVSHLSLLGVWLPAISSGDDFLLDQRALWHQQLLLETIFVHCCQLLSLFLCGGVTIIRFRLPIFMGIRHFLHPLRSLLYAAPSFSDILMPTQRCAQYSRCLPLMHREVVLFGFMSDKGSSSPE